MPVRPSGVAPPFDEGLFLMHYNHGKEAFADGRYGLARQELELAQRFRPTDPDVLNLLGLVYFKTGAYPEAEVIYRQLSNENPSVFILHSNLGLVLFKQGKLDDAEKFLLRSVELRPNHAKSHLYLGLLYKRKGKYGLALEHLRFAGAEKAVRDTEAEMRTLGGSRATVAGPTPRGTIESAPRSAGPFVTQAVMYSRLSEVETPETPFPNSAERHSEGLSSAVRTLQEAVEEHDEDITQEARILDLKRTIEGASRTFTLHENGFLEIDVRHNVHVKRGTVASYSGEIRFVTETGLIGTTAQTLSRASGQGKIFLFERGRKTFLLDLNDEFIYVEGGNLLALEDSLAYRVEPIYDTTYQKKIDTIKIFGRGSLALSTSIEPLTLRVSRAYPLSISSSALVAWTGELIATVLDDDSSLATVMIEEGDSSFRIRFEGEGIVVAEQ